MFQKASCENTLLVNNKPDILLLLSFVTKWGKIIILLSPHRLISSYVFQRVLLLMRAHLLKLVPLV